MSPAPLRSRPVPRAILARGTVLVAGVALVSLAAASPASAASTSRTSTSGFVLTPEHDSDKTIAELEKRLPNASVPTVLKSANRAVRPTTPELLDPQPDGYENGFQFNPGDSDTTKWYPQGITGTSDVDADGKWGDRKALLTSWYAKNPGGKGTVAPGVRVSFITAESLANAKYRHVLLVHPKKPKGKPATFSWSKSHAGGIAWVHRYLYVAETNGGLSVYDTRKMLRVKTGGGDALGCTASGCRAAGYLYVMPRVGVFKQSSKKLKFSSVSVDRSGSTPRLVTSEYRNDEGGARIVRWDLNKRGLMDRDRDGKVRADAAWKTTATDVQGALTRGKQVYISTSAGHSGRNRLYRGTLPGKLWVRGWPKGAEDLVYSPQSKRLYSLTELKGQRSVFAIGAD
ncbi:MAG: hypothetical protein AB7G37_14840 [Solirubrobacteraceae bacterium]